MKMPDPTWRDDYKPKCSEDGWLEIYHENLSLLYYRKIKNSKFRKPSEEHRRRKVLRIARVLSPYMNSHHNADRYLERIEFRAYRKWLSNIAKKTARRVKCRRKAAEKRLLRRKLMKADNRKASRFFQYIALSSKIHDSAINTQEK